MKMDSLDSLTHGGVRSWGGLPPATRSFSVQKPVSPKQERDRPQACQTHQCVNDPADDCSGAAEKPGHQIKLENSNQPPVDTSDNGQDQRNGIHAVTSLFLRMMILCPN